MEKKKIYKGDTVLDNISNHGSISVGLVTKLNGIPVARHAVYQIADSTLDEGAEKLLVFETPGVQGLHEEDLLKIVINRLSSKATQRLNKHLMVAVENLNQAVNELAVYRDEADEL